MEQKIKNKMAQAEAKAVDSLAHYKFLMFGYWAAQWVNLNKLLDKPEPNPFAGYVRQAKPGTATVSLVERELDIVNLALREYEDMEYLASIKYTASEYLTLIKKLTTAERGLTK